MMAVVKRQLDRADIEALWSEKPSEGRLPSARVSPIQRIRTSHHMLAKLLAEGRPSTECQLITGYSSSYISNIQQEPIFDDLVKYYKEQLGEVYLNVHQRLASLGMDIVDEIQDRLTTDPDSFTLKDLEEVGKMTLDRAGYGPQSTINHKGAVALVTPDQLSRIKGEIERNQQGRTIPHSPSDNPTTEMGEVIEHEPLAQAAPSGDAGEGDNLSEQSGEADKAESPG